MKSLGPLGTPSPVTDAATSARLARQRQADTSPELALRRELHRRGLRYFTDRAPLPGLRRRADLVFPRRRVAVYVDGCFWHRCPQHATFPKNNARWWSDKLAGNVARDRDTDARLVAAGWRVVRVWEHECVTAAADRVQDVMRRADGVRGGALAPTNAAPPRPPRPMRP